MTPIEQIDATLTYLNTENDDKDLLELENYFMNKRDRQINNRDLKRIVMKLIRENYLGYHLKEGYTDLAGAVYYISFEGKLLLQQGGYTVKLRNEATESQRLRNLEFSRDSQSKRLNVLTAWIAVGTIVAAAYYATELYWKYHWFH